MFDKLRPPDSITGYLLSYYAVAVLLLVAMVVGLQMYDLASGEKLWGIRPLLLLLSGWFGFAIWRQRRDRVGVFAWASGAGVLLGISFAPYGAIWAPVLGFAALLRLVRLGVAGGLTRKQVLWYAYHAMVVFNVVSTWWVANTALAAGIVANFLNAFFQALVVLLIYGAARRLPKFWVPGAVALWIGFEYLHFNWQIAWPWLCLGHTFSPAPALAQWFSLTGVFGGSLVVTASGALLSNAYAAYRNRGGGFRQNAVRWALVAAMAILAVPALISVWMGRASAQSERSPGTLRVAAVQPNYEPHYRKFQVNRAEQLLAFEQLTRRAIGEGAQLVVYPETSFGGVDEGSVLRAPFVGMWEAARGTRPTEVSLLTGLSSYKRLAGPTDDPALRTQGGPGGRTSYYIAHNSALALAGDAAPRLYYKSKLVPGVEFLPYRKLLFFFEPLVASLGGTTAGLGRNDGAEVFDLPGDARVAPLICYESIYGDYVRQFVSAGANLLVIPTNDGWWDDSPGYRQHFNLARLRAIETRRWVVQAANSGTSGFVDPFGRAYAKTAYDTATVTSHDVGLNEGLTFYVRWGDVIGQLAAIASVGLLGLLMAARFRTP